MQPPRPTAGWGDSFPATMSPDPPILPDVVSETREETRNAYWAKPRQIDAGVWGNAVGKLEQGGRLHCSGKPLSFSRFRSRIQATAPAPQRRLW